MPIHIKTDRKKNNNKQRLLQQCFKRSTHLIPKFVYFRFAQYSIFQKKKKDLLNIEDKIYTVP